MIALSNVDFIKINKDNDEYFGGNQNWWSKSYAELNEYGCGVVAICNLEIYLSGDNIECALSHTKYMDYLEERYFKDYGLLRCKMFQKLGLLPGKMRRGLEKFFDEKNLNYVARWAPTIIKNKIRQYIEEMLHRDIPIVASYYVFNKKNKLNLYEFDGNKKLQLKTSIGSHYFNIVGIEVIDDKEYLVISSWGKRYYALYNRWVEKISIFSNILYLKRREG